jgi:hypothetical protein
LVPSNHKPSSGSTRTLIEARLLLALLLGALNACAAQDSPRGTAPQETEGDHAAPRRDDCPATLPAPAPLSSTPEDARTLAYWLRATGATLDLDAPLADAGWKHDHNAAIHGEGGIGALSAGSLYDPIDEAQTVDRLNARLAFSHRALSEGSHVAADGSKIPVEPLAPFATMADVPGRTDELRVALEPLMLRCTPRPEGYYRVPIDLDFDRNNYSAVREGEELRILGRWPNGMQLARTRYALGFIAGSAKLGEPRDREEARAARRAEVERSPPLTRRAFLTEAFALLDAPYGWGGQSGGRDCSRYVLDLLGGFGVEMPRHSASQAAAGRYSIDVEGIANLDAKLALIDAAHENGIVLLEFAGHIMIYLGRYEDGRPMVIHSFSEYLEACEGGGETVRRVDRVEVSDLSLGAGTSRTSFLERIRRVTVLADHTAESLRSVAEYRQASPARRGAECRDSLEVAIFAFPRVAIAGQPLRIVATTRRDLGPVDLSLFDERGERVPAEARTLGGGPVYGYVLSTDTPPAGRLEARLGDGTRLDACQRVVVRRFPSQETEPRDPSAAAWTPRWKWEEDTENLFSTFVEHLFVDAAPGQTFTDLDAVLDDAGKNFLHGALGMNEEARLRLSPDCADLPYFLRAYFAWKLSLPFGFRACSRGRDDRPPRCSDELVTSLEPTSAADDVGAFQSFLRKTANTVHSSSMRTRPRDEDADAYPIALTHASLAPGTVFADPYGHILVVVRQVPQRKDVPGALVAVDAQPDGNMGMRTFWRGSFLFDPDTKTAGAGFKAFRPLVFEAAEERVVPMPYDAIEGPLAFSMEQYEGTADDFYRKVEGAVSPRPLDAKHELMRLVDALEENVTRRVLSVQNGEDFVRARAATMEMPEGAAIFQTSGPWEDFATPSRDLRLLISIDQVLGFPERAAAHPERFVGEVDRAALQALLESELRSRRFSYAGSAGLAREVDLFTLTQRAEHLEMAYNPNDCVEVRWGADPATEEGASCARRAPDEQRERMESLRGWFRDRSRPAR